MNLLFYAMVTATGFCGLGMLASLMLSRTARATSRRVSLMIDRNHPGQPGPTRSGELQKNVLKAFTWIRERLPIPDDPKLAERFERAGLFAPAYRDVYLAARVAGPVLAFAFGSCIEYKRSFWMISLSAVTYLIPDIFLTRIIKRRQEKIRLSSLQS